MIKVKKVESGKLQEEALSKFCHDLRTPLTVMKMLTELLELSGAPKVREAKLKKFKRSIDKEINRMVKMLS